MPDERSTHQQLTDMIERLTDEQAAALLQMVRVIVNRPDDATLQYPEMLEELNDAAEPTPPPADMSDETPDDLSDEIDTWMDDIKPVEDDWAKKLKLDDD